MPSRSTLNWVRWFRVTEEETCAFAGDLAQRLCLTPEQHQLWDRYVETLLKSVSASMLPDPGGGWDQGRSAALDQWLRFEIAAGRFLGRIEDARESFGRLYAVLTPAQQRLIDASAADACRHDG